MLHRVIVIFINLNDWKRHLRSCLNVTKFKYPGGFLKRKKTIFDELAEFNIYVPEQERFFPYFIVFDCEAMLEKVRIQTSEKLVWTQKHTPISVSVCSNVPTFSEAKCFICSDLDILLSQMVEYMEKIAAKVEKLTKEKWSGPLERLKELIKEYGGDDKSTEDPGDEDTMSDGEEEEECVTDTDDEDFIDDTVIDEDVMYHDLDEVFEERTDQERDRQPEQKQDPHKFIKKHLCTLFGEFKTYCSQVPVLSFNGGRYDLNLLKGKLAKKFNLHKDPHAFVIKKTNNYTCISTEDFKFLDVTNYLAPGFSYAAFLKAFGVQEKKGFFPYDWFDSIEKLDYPELPPYDAFYSNLKKVNVLDVDGEGQKNYEWLQEVWEVERFTSFKQFLELYNNLDVQPLVQAVQKMQLFYREKNIDLFKIAVSVPGIARKLLFVSTNANFPLFSYATQDIFKTIKKSCFGGPSIIFTRKHKVNETLIRNDPDKVCQAIRGEDANALYVRALQEPFGTGCFVDRKGPSFKPEPCTKFMSMYFWMDYLAKKDSISIKHRLNNENKEVRIGPYPVDGFCEATNTVYEFQGCYFHGDVCELTQHCNEKWKERQPKLQERTKQKIEYLKNLGYNVIEMKECDYKKDIEPHIDDIRTTRGCLWGVLDLRSRAARV